MLNADIAKRALQKLAEELVQAEPGIRVDLLLVGGVAGMLAGELEPARTTIDCDVIAVRPDHRWEAVLRAAGHIADEFELAETWLNQDSRMYAWMLPLGWDKRAERVVQQKGVTVRRVSRIDLICLKVMGTPHRPVDREDLQQLKPTTEELEFVVRHLDRLEQESLNQETFGFQRSYVAKLRNEHDRS